MDYQPRKVWRYKGHRILTWTEDDGVGAGLRRWFYKIDAGETVRAFAGGHERDYEAWSCAFQDACGKIDSNKQDKRSVISLEAADFDQWLKGTVDQARALMKVARVEVSDAGPTDAAQKEIA